MALFYNLKFRRNYQRLYPRLMLKLLVAFMLLWLLFFSHLLLKFKTADLNIQTKSLQDYKLVLENLNHSLGCSVWQRQQPEDLLEIAATLGLVLTPTNRLEHLSVSAEVAKKYEPFYGGLRLAQIEETQQMPLVWSLLERFSDITVAKGEQ